MNQEIPLPLKDVSPGDFRADELAEEHLPPPELTKQLPGKEEIAAEESKPETATKKPLFWSAAPQTPTVAHPESADSVAVPPVLRNLQKCQACGFPVSRGRTLCVECEEKQWRGQRLAAPIKEPVAEIGPPVAGVANAPQRVPAAPVESTAKGARPLVDSSPVVKSPADLPASDNSTLFSSSAAPSESWFAANKYILGALLVVALVIGAIIWLR
jgi:hypothetical protein